MKTVLQIAFQLLERIELVHSVGLVYRDVKPENFLLGRKGTSDAKTIHLIDFGLATMYRDKETGDHLPFKDLKTMTGTARYMSVHSHLGKSQSRRDDLESVGYTLVYFAKGKLPWQGFKSNNIKEKYRRIRESKIKLSPSTVCEGLPSQFADYLTYVKKLNYAETPDYTYIKDLFRRAYKQLGLQLKSDPSEYTYDWDSYDAGSGVRRYGPSIDLEEPSIETEHSTQVVGAPTAPPLAVPEVSVTKSGPITSQTNHPLSNHNSNNNQNNNNSSSHNQKPNVKAAVNRIESTLNLNNLIAGNPNDDCSHQDEKHDTVGELSDIRMQTQAMAALATSKWNIKSMSSLSSGETGNTDDHQTQDGGRFDSYISSVTGKRASLSKKSSSCQELGSQGYHSYSESRDGELGDVSDRHSAELNGGGGGSGHPSLSAAAMVARVATPRPGANPSSVGGSSRSLAQRRRSSNRTLFQQNRGVWTSEEDEANGNTEQPPEGVVTTQVRRLSGVGGEVGGISIIDPAGAPGVASSSGSGGGGGKSGGGGGKPKIITEEAVYTEDKVSFLCFTWRRKKRDVTTRHQDQASSKIDVKVSED